MAPPGTGTGAKFWKRCEHVPGRGNCGERERGTFQKPPEGQMAGSKSEGELVGGEVT